MSSFRPGSRSRFVGFALLLGVLLFAVPSAFAGEQDFVLINRTGVEIYQVFVSPASAKDWQEDVMGSDTLPDGEQVEIQFDREEDAELWDLRITDSEGNGIEWEDLDLTAISVLTLHYEDGRAWADAE